MCAARKFFDPAYTSCTSFLAHIASSKFGFKTEPMADMIHWANIVDGAQYESPESAVEMAAPAMKLTLIIESTQDPHFIPRLIPLLTEMPLAEVLAQPFVAELAAAAAGASPRAIELIRPRSEERDGTIFFDITDHPMEGFNKFIPYYLHPQATYSIGLSKSSFRTKVAVGSNPWTKADPAKMVNLAADLRALRWRRSCAGGSDQLPARPGGSGAASCYGDRGGAAVEKSAVDLGSKPMTEPIRVRPETPPEPIRHLFAYGTLQPGLAPREIAPLVEKLRPVGEGFLFGKLYDLGSYPGAVIDPASAWLVYGTVYELLEDVEILRKLDAYEGPEYVRIEQLVTLTAGGGMSCWVYDVLGQPSEERFIESGRWGARRPMQP